MLLFVFPINVVFKPWPLYILDMVNLPLIYLNIFFLVTNVIFQGNLSFSSREKEFEGISPNMDMAVILVIWPEKSFLYPKESPYKIWVQYKNNISLGNLTQVSYRASVWWETNDETK